MSTKDLHSWRDDIQNMDDDKQDEGTITQEQAASELAVLLDCYDWFYSVEVESGRIVVYVNKMNADILRIVPEVLYGYKPIVAFSSHLLCGEKYGKSGSGKSVLKSPSIKFM
jgi:hypothetical protein